MIATPVTASSIKSGAYHESEPFAKISNRSFKDFKILKSSIYAHFFQETFTLCIEKK